MHSRTLIFIILTFLSFGFPHLICAKSDGEQLDELTKKGYNLFTEGKLEEAVGLYREALGKYSDIDDGEESRRNLIKIYNNLGNIYLFEFHSPEQAYTWLLKAKEMAEKYNQNDLLAYAYGNIGKLYDDFGDTRNALHYFRASLKTSVNVNSDVANKVRLMVLDNLATFAINRDLIDSIADDIKNYDHFPEADIPMSRYTRELARSLILVSEGKYKDAADVLEKAGPHINSKVNVERYKINHLLALATILNYAGETSKAINCLNEALRDIETSSLPLSDVKIRVLNLMSKMYNMEGKDSEASRYRLQALEVSDSLYNAKKFGNVRDIESMMQIDELNRHVELSQLELKYQRRLIWILGTSTFLILILLVGLGWYTRKLNQTHLELVKRHKEAMRQRQEELKKLKEPRKIPGDQQEHLKMLEAVKNIFANDNIIYDSSFSLNQLAEKLNIKPKYLSALINDNLNTSFNQLLAEARIAESCRLLLDTEIGQKLTIEAVAEKVGYRSRTHFISIFNKITGLTPSQYIKASKKDV